MTKKRILTGDRPTGPLHLGHYVGTLKNRVALQERNEVFVLVADLHALTRDISPKITENLKGNIRELVLDYLSVGIDPKKATIYLQSSVPEVTELATIFSMLIPVPRLQRVPTLKQVLRDEKIPNPSLGLLAYPVLMAADICLVKGEVVPVGKDQASHLEVTREIVRDFNKRFGEVFPLPEPLIEGEVLPGIDGKAKMSKSLGNAIMLSETEESLREKVMGMYTDPKRVRADIPGKVEGNPVFSYHEAFNPNKEEIEDLKARYRKGKVGDVEVKEKLFVALNNFLKPIREKRGKLAKDPGLVDSILLDGKGKITPIAERTLEEVRRAVGLSSR